MLRQIINQKKGDFKSTTDFGIVVFIKKIITIITEIKKKGGASKILIESEPSYGVKTVINDGTNNSEYKSKVYLCSKYCYLITNIN